MCELELGVADSAELRPIAKRLLEVVADNLRRLDDSLSASALHPVGEALVKLCRRLFGVAR